MKTENKLNALLSLYNNLISEITFYQNQGDNTSIINIVTIIVIPLLEVFNADTFIISIICLFAPVVQ